jgi:hypothetical protein
VTLSVCDCCGICTDAALGSKRAWHHVDILGSNGQQLGRVRVGFRVAKPIDKLLLQQQQQEAAAAEAEAVGHEQQRDATAEPDGAAAQALQQAAEQVRLNPNYLLAVHIRGLVCAVMPYGTHTSTTSCTCTCFTAEGECAESVMGGGGYM